MIPTEVFTEELLQQAAAELATALNDNLPPPCECQHKFSDIFEEKMHEGGYLFFCFCCFRFLLF